MKVAYINCLLSHKGQLGVERKLAAQVKAISTLGIDLDVFYINFGRKIRDSQVKFFERRSDLLSQYLSVLTRYCDVFGHLNTSRYDFLVLRYGGGDFSIFSKLFRGELSKIITEHHTKELPEAFTYKSFPVQKAITIFMEKYFSPGILRRCHGLIAVTDEIREYELQRAGIPKPACTIPNGVLVEEVPFSGHSIYNGRVLNLLCLANAFEPWQGLDRIVEGLKQYKARKPRVLLRVVGYVPLRSLKGLNRLNCQSNVKVDFLGELHGQDLERVFAETHVGFSSMALFRKGMKEACALKTREFAARGLPFILDHKDPDFSATQGFFLPVSSDDKPVDMDEVVTFAERILAWKGLPEYMRAYARQRLDWKKKMEKMWDFLESSRN
jgi:glycosyltransferase involved in cell wall biosynthesis